jgi:hypothetical protein
MADGASQNIIGERWRDFFLITSYSGIWMGISVRATTKFTPRGRRGSRAVYLVRIFAINYGI